MICTDCQHENHPQARFCSKCGRDLIVVVEPVVDTYNGLSSTITFFLVLLGYVVITHFIGAVESYHEILFIDIAFASIVLIFFMLNYSKTIVLFKIPKFNPTLMVAMVVGAAAFAFIVFHVADYLNQSLFDQTQVAYYDQFVDSPAPFFFTILSVGFFPAVFEEIACRGIMFNQLEKIAGVGSTIIVTTIIFTMLHLSLLSILWIFPIGLLFGFLRARHNTIWYGIVGHFVYNSSIVIFEIIL